MIKITVTDDERICTFRGNFKEICAETAIALRTLIKSIEEVNDKSAKEFSLMLPEICALAILDDEEREAFAKFIRESKKDGEV